MHQRLISSLAGLLLLALPGLGRAEPIDVMTVQGTLSTADGVPLDGDVNVVATLYGDGAGTQVVHTQALVVAVDEGFFTTWLTGLDLAIFADHNELWLGLAVGADPEMDLVEITTTPWAGSAAHAVTADDAANLGGAPPEDYRLVSEPIAWTDILGVPALLGDLTCSNGAMLQFDLAANSWVCIAAVVETDPEFTASPAASVTAGDLASWDTAYGWGDHGAAGYLSAEADPTFTASDVAGVTTSDLASWAAAYGWGDHGAAGYLTSEADPAFAASPASAISTVELDHWNTAYGWGDHSLEGYLVTESDPTFSASPVAGVTSGQILDWTDAYDWGDHAAAGYVSSESDPVYGASAASGISSGQVGDWNTAYGWGDHGVAGYVSSESDPVYGASAASSISSGQVGNWNTAYGWGDHGGAGYLSAEVDGSTTNELNSSVGLSGNSLQVTDAGGVKSVDLSGTYSTITAANAAYMNVAGDTMTGDAEFDGRVRLSSGNGAGNGIDFDPDPGGGTGDTATIRYYAVTGEQTRLALATTNDADDEIALSVAGGDIVVARANQISVGAAMAQTRCPSGYTLRGGVCTRYLSGPGETTWSNWQEACHGDNARICTYRDVLLSWGATTIHPEVVAGDWLGDFVADDTVLYVNSRNSKSNFEGTASKAGSEEAICCITPY